MQLRLQNFDGPLDLLLHLIRAQEVNIFNIPMSIIAEQYLSFLRHVPDLDYHVVGEYLAMAAQLVEIKANLLVPALQNKIADAQTFADMAEEDPRKPLVAQLLEFEAIKQACLELEGLDMLGRDVFASGESVRREKEFEDLTAPIKGDPFSLVIAFERLLLRFAEKQSAPKVRVRAQKVTIQSRMMQVKRRLELALQVGNDLTLRDMFDDCETRYDLIVTIMAVLELSKANHLNLEQGELFAPIFLRVGEKFYDAAPELEGESPDTPEAQPTLFS